MRLRQIHQRLDRGRREVGAHHDGERVDDERRYDHEVLRIVGKLRVGVRIDGLRLGARDEQRISVGGGLRHGRRAHHSGGAGPVLHDEGTGQACGQMLGNDTPGGIGGPAGRPGHDDPDRLGRIVLGERGSGHREKRRNDQPRQFHASSPMVLPAAWPSLVASSTPRADLQSPTRRTSMPASRSGATRRSSGARGVDQERKVTLSITRASPLYTFTYETRPSSNSASSCSSASTLISTRFSLNRRSIPWRVTSDADCAIESRGVMITTPSKRAWRSSAAAYVPSVWSMSYTTAVPGCRARSFSTSPIALRKSGTSGASSRGSHGGGIISAPAARTTQSGADPRMSESVALTPGSTRTPALCAAAS